MPPNSDSNLFEKKYGHLIEAARSSEDNRMKQLQTLHKEFEFLSKTAQDIIKAAGGERMLMELGEEHPMFQELIQVQNRMVGVSKNMREVSEAKNAIPQRAASNELILGQGEDTVRVPNVERTLTDPTYAMEEFNRVRGSGNARQIELYADFLGDQYINEIVNRSAEMQLPLVAAPGPALSPATPQDQNEIQRALATVRSFYEPKSPPGLGAQPTQQTGQEAVRQVENMRRGFLRERNQ